MIKLRKLLLLLALVGLIDSGYLTYEHFNNEIISCSTSIFSDCGSVLNSEYSRILGIPVAIIGMAYYSTLALLLLFIKVAKKYLSRFFLLISFVGFLISLWFVSIQLFVIRAICPYCMLSAVTSILIFYFAQKTFSKERVYITTFTIASLYKYVLRKIFFTQDPEKVHNSIIILGEKLGNSEFTKSITGYLANYKDTSLEQTIHNIKLENPIGLAAGFDYEARLTQFLPSLGFGFQTVGTITNMPYKGNPKPLLGRLPKSKSLMVNKGFKNSGANEVSERLSKLNYKIPLGISIGRTNSLKLKTVKQSIKDIVLAFQKFEDSKVKNSYYELNISCPNLIHSRVSFYPPENLKKLLIEIDKLKLTKPILVKMPIEKSDKETLKMLDIISKHTPKGVILGNLQKDRKHKTLINNEVEKFKVGYFSGKPAFERSNQLISLAYKNFKERFVIVGCGGVFSAEDAYLKIQSGASLIQLITGLVFEGPQLVSQISIGLANLIKEDGFNNISQAVGSNNC